MSNPFDRLVQDIADLRRKVDDERTTLRIGTVQSGGGVLLTDGAVVEPAATLAPVEAGDRVLVAGHRRRVAVLGHADAPPPPSTPPPPAEGPISTVDMTKAVDASRSTVCVTPIPSAPSGGQAVHTSVVYIPEGLNGYTYWAAYTPYPAADAAQEDPVVAASNDGITWAIPSGSNAFPIANAPFGTNDHHSDTHLTWHDGLLWCFWRHNYFTGAEPKESYYFSTSADGVTWSAKTQYLTSNTTVRQLLSPNVIFEDGAWTLYAIDMGMTPNRLVRFRSTGASPQSGWSPATTCTITSLPGGTEPWHVSVKKQDDGTCIGLVSLCTDGTSATTDDLLLIHSTNGTAWTSSGKTVISRSRPSPNPHDKLYQGTLVPGTRDGVPGWHCWYSGRDGTAWWIYRTFIYLHLSGGPVEVRHGQHVVPTVNANAGGGGGAQSYGTPFASATNVYISVMLPSARLTWSTTAMTASGFTLLIDNHSDANAVAPGTAYWRAERYA